MTNSGVRISRKNERYGTMKIGTNGSARSSTVAGTVVAANHSVC
jgi:hypothetical protein